MPSQCRRAATRCCCRRDPTRDARRGNRAARDRRLGLRRTVGAADGDGRRLRRELRPVFLGRIPAGSRHRRRGAAERRYGAAADPARGGQRAAGRGAGAWRRHARAAQPAASPGAGCSRTTTASPAVTVESRRISRLGVVGLGAARDRSRCRRGTPDRAILTYTLDLTRRGLLPGDTVRYRAIATDNTPQRQSAGRGSTCSGCPTMSEVRAAQRAATAAVSSRPRFDRRRRASSSSGRPTTWPRSGRVPAGRAR